MDLCTWLLKWYDKLMKWNIMKRSISEIFILVKLVYIICGGRRRSHSFEHLKCLKGYLWQLLKWKMIGSIWDFYRNMIIFLFSYSIALGVVFIHIKLVAWWSTKLTGGHHNHIIMLHRFTFQKLLSTGQNCSSEICNSLGQLLEAVLVQVNLLHWPPLRMKVVLIQFSWLSEF